MQDICGRQITYLRISVTDLCNLRCRYCIPEAGVVQKCHTEILSYEEILQVVRAAAALGVEKIRITGGEPLVRRGITELVRMIAGVPGIRDLSLTTNGLLLGDMAQDLKGAGLGRVNVSLDTLNPEKYAQITRGGDLRRVLAGLQAAREAGLAPIKINTVLIGGFNDDEIADFAQLTRQEALDVRFIELMPIGEASTWTEGHFIPSQTVLDRLPQLEAEPEGGDGGPARHWRLPGALGRIGLINPISSHFCGTCNRIRLTADGRLKPCLHTDREIDLRPALGDPTALQDLIRLGVRQKPEGHRINGCDFAPVTRNMHQIGG